MSYANVKTGINWLNEKRNKLNENAPHSLLCSCFHATILPQITDPLLSVKAKQGLQSLYVPGQRPNARNVSFAM